MRVRGRGPSFEEVRKLFGYQSKNAAHWLIARLKEKKLLSQDARGKIIVRGAQGIKLLGTVAAGFPSPAEEELVDVLSLDEYLIKHPESTYMIRVVGDSMMDAGIHPGDLVLVERGRQPQQRDIVIAQVDGEWTMKFYEKVGKDVVLKPANKKYKTIVPRESLMMGGVVVSVVRKYK